MIVGVPKEIYPRERRVALVPAVIPNLKKAGLELWWKRARASERVTRTANTRKKARSWSRTAQEIFQTADIIVQFLVHGANDKTGSADLPLMRKGQVMLGFLRPLGTVEDAAGNCGSRGDRRFPWS